MAAYYEHGGITILQGDCREILPTLPDQSVNCCVTSPPYWGLRDYGVSGQLGLEPTPEEYVSRMVEVFREVRRVLRDDGTLWLNLGDCYVHDRFSSPMKGDYSGTDGLYQRRADPVGIQPKRSTATGLKVKDLVGIPWRVAFALQADGWYLRSDIIWHKPNPMPESVTDRPTKAHEYLFLLSKSEKYHYDADAIREPFATDPKENYPARAYITGRGDQDAAAVRGNDRGKSGGFPPKISADRKDLHGPTYERHRLSINGGQALGMPEGGRNKRSVWTIATEPYPEAHFATFPTALIEPCIKAGCPAGGTVLDPFGGSGTTAQVARALGCCSVLIELNEKYCRMAANRLRQDVLDLAEASA